MTGAGESADNMARELRDRATGLRAKADELEAKADRSEVGADGERRVATVLAPLESPSCHVLHDRLLDPSTSRVNLDHIVVSVAGIFLVDAKNWAGNVVEFEGSLWQHKFGTAGQRVSVPMNPEVDKVRRMAEQVETVSARVVEPVMCLTGENADRFGPARSIRGADLRQVRGDRPGDGRRATQDPRVPARGSPGHRRFVPAGRLRRRRPGAGRRPDLRSGSAV